MAGEQSSHEFQYPTVTELEVVHQRFDRDTFCDFDSLEEPDNMGCVIAFAKKLVKRESFKTPKMDGIRPTFVDKSVQRPSMPSVELEEDCQCDNVIHANFHRKQL